MPARTFNLSRLDGRNGFALQGDTLGDQSGRSVASAGDINDDGIDDVIIGAHDADPNDRNSAGEAYVVFGHRGLWPADMLLSSLNGSNGYTLLGVARGDQSGRSVTSAGDMNGDGIDDVMIGAHDADPNGLTDAGAAYVVFGHRGSWPAVMPLSSLNGSNGFVLQGGNARDYAGRSVASAGDVNGDGVDDIILGAPDADPNGLTDAGAAYVVFGHRGGWPATMPLTSLNGSNGFVLEGVAGVDQAGNAVASTRDMNGDGVDDVIIGAYAADSDGHNRAGEAYVVFGHRGAWPAVMSPSSLNGSNGFVLAGVHEGDQAGYLVASAGDMNGDGVDDMIIGANDADPNGRIQAGASYVVFGHQGAWPGVLQLSSLNGSNGFVLGGVDSYDQSGVSVSTSGDLNGDGIDDVIIGAHNADPHGGTNAGVSYVVFGHSGAWPAVMSLSSLNGLNGVVLQGIDSHDATGESVARAGDVNGDGVDDVIIGARHADPSGQSGAGASYVIFGGSEPFIANQITIESGQMIRLNQNNLAVDPVIGTRVFNVSNVTHGRFVSNSNISQTLSSFTQQEINDGGVLFIHDGSRQAPNYTVCAQGITRVFSDVHPQSPNVSFTVVAPRISAPHSVFNLSQLDGRSGFVLEGITASDASGISVASGGDFNDDGVDDVIVGAYAVDFNGSINAGEAYVIFGHRGSWPAAMPLSSLNGSNGLRLQGINTGDHTGISVASAGDINGDGIDDVIMGARHADPNGRTDAGEAYVVFGHQGPWPTTMLLSSLNGSNGLVLQGINADDRTGSSVASAGDINGDGVDDVIIGAFFADPNTQTNAGAAYVVFGRRGTWLATLSFTSLNGLNGFLLEGINTDDYAGRSVATAGDINGDGIDDVIIGAYAADPNGHSRAGEAYVVFGHRGTWPGTLSLSSLNGSNGFLLEGIHPDDHAGYSVAAAGDINGDGIDDVIVGAQDFDSNGFNNAGASYVVFGHGRTWPASLSLSSLNGSNGFVLEGINAGDNAGRSVASAGDINGDGVDDVIIGAHNADPNGRSGGGEAYAVFGQRGSWPAAMPLSSLNGLNGLVFQGINTGDSTGMSVAFAGDINGDGKADVIIGAYNAGASYVIFGGSEPFSANQLSIRQGDTIRLNASHLAVDPLIDYRYFNVTDVEHGHFALNGNRLSSIDSFNQSQISSGEIVFVHDGSVHAPNYTVSAQGITRVFSNVHPQVANISFHRLSESPTLSPTALPTSSPMLSPTLGIIQSTTTLLTTLSGLNVISTTPESRAVDEEGSSQDNTLLYVIVAVVASILVGVGVILGMRYNRKREQSSLGKEHSNRHPPMTLNPAYRGPGDTSGNAFGETDTDTETNANRQSSSVTALTRYGVFGGPRSSNDGKGRTTERTPSMLDDDNYVANLSGSTEGSQITQTGMYVNPVHPKRGGNDEDYSVPNLAGRGFDYHEPVQVGDEEGGYEEPVVLI